ncbi:MAG: hypothetical protein WC327_06710 [Candidatus Cloacimonadia bacterium]
MSRLTIIAILVGLISFASISLQAEPLNTFNTNNMNLSGLLNPNRLNVKHSMSFLSGVSSRGNGYYQSTYTNHLFYNLSPKLDLQLDQNFVNYGTATVKDSFSIKGNNDNKSGVIPEFSLNYRPSENFNIIFEMRSVGPFNRYDDNFYFRR